MSESESNLRGRSSSRQPSQHCAAPPLSRSASRWRSPAAAGSPSRRSPRPWSRRGRGSSLCRSAPKKPRTSVPACRPSLSSLSSPSLLRLKMLSAVALPPKFGLLLSIWPPQLTCCLFISQRKFPGQSFTTVWRRSVVSQFSGSFPVSLQGKQFTVSQCLNRSKTTSRIRHALNHALKLL